MEATEANSANTSERTADSQISTLRRVDHPCHDIPATTDARSTSVGSAAILRFVRPVAYQNFPQQLLPDALKDNNPLNILRIVNGERSKDVLQ